MVRVVVRNLPEAQRTVQGLIGNLGPGGVRLEFFNNLGLAVLRWVDVNFATAGQLVGGWRPLRPLTVFGRRQGSSVPLSDTGGLRQSFTYKATDSSVAIGTAKAVARYHQFGTQPYVIRPRRKKVLAFPAPPEWIAAMQAAAKARGRSGPGLYVRRRKAGTPVKGATTLTNLRKAFPGRRFKVPKGPGQFQSLAIVRKVNHPGLPARPMLPRTINDITKEIADVANDWTQRNFQGGTTTVQS